MRFLRSMVTFYAFVAHELLDEARKVAESRQPR